MPQPTRIALVVEDELSLAVLEQVAAASDQRFDISRRFVERGFGNIKRSIAKYIHASHVLPHVVLTDLDRSKCPLELRDAWGATNLPDSMLFRVAVHETEAWLLADQEAFAEFASVQISRIHAHPENEPDPKQTLINIVRRSRNRNLRDELIPEQGSTASIGPLYNERLCNFVRTTWRANVAAQHAPSLKRAIERLSTFMR